jgi:hypothetical protein
MAAPAIPGSSTQAVNTVGSTQNFTPQWWNFFNSLLTFITVGPIGPIPITGVVDGSDAAAGIIGEYKNSVVQAASAVALTEFISADVLTLVLPAGDWDVWGDVLFTVTATTAVFELDCWIGTASVTKPTVLPAAIARVQNSAGDLSNGDTPITVNGLRMRLSTSAASTTLYLSTNTQFTTDTLAAYGQLQARRVR